MKKTKALILSTLMASSILITACGSSILKSAHDVVIEKNSFAATYLNLAKDGSYLEVDTNPEDVEEYLSIEGVTTLKQVNKELNLPDSVFQQMGTTTSLMGRQEYERSNISVSWTYHPDRGLEAIYEIRR